MGKRLLALLSTVELRSEAPEPSELLLKIIPLDDFGVVQAINPLVDYIKHPLFPLHRIRCGRRRIWCSGGCFEVHGSASSSARDLEGPVRAHGRVAMAGEMPSRGREAKSRGTPMNSSTKSRVDALARSLSLSLFKRGVKIVGNR